MVVHRVCRAVGRELDPNSIPVGTVQVHAQLLSRWVVQSNLLRGILVYT